MNRTALGLAAGLVLVASAPGWVVAQSSPPGLQGAWAVQEVTRSNPPANWNKPTGLIQFSGRHFSMVANNDSTRPPLPEGGLAKATADQLRATWGPLVVNAGTFTVTGNTLRLTNVVAKIPGGSAPGNFAEWSFTLNGDSLSMTEMGGQNGPPQNPVTLRLTRAK